MSVPLPSDGTPSDRTYHRPRARRKPLIAAAAGATALAWAFLRWRPFRVEIAGPSMRPALEPGDWALAIATPRVRRGAVVVVQHPRRPDLELVKRVTALPGDVSPAGRVLGHDEFWVEGDSPGDSTDSRQFGPVRRQHVKAEVRVVYWPRGRRRLL
jgi:signal peptidase I